MSVNKRNNHLEVKKQLNRLNSDARLIINFILDKSPNCPESKAAEQKLDSLYLKCKLLLDSLSYRTLKEEEQCEILSKVNLLLLFKRIKNLYDENSLSKTKVLKQLDEILKKLKKEEDPLYFKLFNSVKFWRDKMEVEKNLQSIEYELEIIKRQFYLKEMDLFQVKRRMRFLYEKQYKSIFKLPGYKLLDGVEIIAMNNFRKLLVTFDSEISKQQPSNSDCLKEIKRIANLWNQKKLTNSEALKKLRELPKELAKGCPLYLQLLDEIRNVSDLPYNNDNFCREDRNKDEEQCVDTLCWKSARNLRSLISRFNITVNNKDYLASIEIIKNITSLYSDIFAQRQGVDPDILSSVLKHFLEVGKTLLDQVLGHNRMDNIFDNPENLRVISNWYRNLIELKAWANNLFESNNIKKQVVWEQFNQMRTDVVWKQFSKQEQYILSKQLAKLRELILQEGDVIENSAILQQVHNMKQLVLGKLDDAQKGIVWQKFYDIKNFVLEQLGDIDNAVVFKQLELKLQKGVDKFKTKIDEMAKAWRSSDKGKQVTKKLLDCINQWSLLHKSIHGSSKVFDFNGLQKELCLHMVKILSQQFETSNNSNCKQIIAQVKELRKLAVYKHDSNIKSMFDDLYKDLSDKLNKRNYLPTLLKKIRLLNINETYLLESLCQKLFSAKEIESLVKDLSFLPDTSVNDYTSKELFGVIVNLLETIALKGTDRQKKNIRVTVESIVNDKELRRVFYDKGSAKLRQEFQTPLIRNITLDGQIRRLNAQSWWVYDSARNSFMKQIKVALKISTPIEQLKQLVIIYRDVSEKFSWYTRTKDSKEVLQQILIDSIINIIDRCNDDHEYQLFIATIHGVSKCSESIKYDILTKSLPVVLQNKKNIGNNSSGGGVRFFGVARFVSNDKFSKPVRASDHFNVMYGF